MKNNKGFSLIELVVVIALMAIIAGVSSYIGSIVTKQELKDFTNNLDAMLCQCKVETMSGMSDPALVISVEGDVYKATLYKNYNSSSRTVVKSQYLGEDYLTCKYYYKDNRNTESRDVSALRPVVFSYDRNTGELLNQTSVKLEVGYKERFGAYSIEFVPQTGYHKIVK